MNQIISITQFARLRNVTTETLRHYDRIGLLKPICKKNGIRYYSILQYEKLGTIKELQQLGLSLKEIQSYFENRSIDETYKLLLNKQVELTEKIEDMKRLQKTVEKRISFLSTLKNTPISNEVTEKIIPKRQFMYIDSDIYNDTELSYSVLELENLIPKDDYLPIFATNRYAGIIAKEAFYQKEPSAKVAIQVEEEEKLEPVIKVPEHLYVCTYSIGTFFEREQALERLRKYIKEKGYKIDGDIIQMSWVDYAITDNEMSYEFQVPVVRVKEEVK